MNSNVRRFAHLNEIGVVGVIVAVVVEVRRYAGSVLGFRSVDRNEQVQVVAVPVPVGVAVQPVEGQAV